MTLTDLYYQANGTAFHHEITEDIAVAYLSGIYEDITEANEYSSKLEEQTSTLEDEVSDLQSTVTDLEEERDQLQDELTDMKDTLKRLNSRSHRLIQFLKNDVANPHISLLPTDIPELIEVLEILT